MSCYADNIKNDIIDDEFIKAIIEYIKFTARMLADVHKYESDSLDTAENVLLYSAKHNNYLNDMKNNILSK
jgi:hypothetical protein